MADHLDNYQREVHQLSDWMEKAQVSMETIERAPLQQQLAIQQVKVKII